MNREEMQTELDALKARITEIEFQLEAQITAPGWAPFPGEIMECRDSEGHGWSLDCFVEHIGANPYPWKCSRTLWEHARPLSDPNVIQLRPHTPGDPMPCDPDVQVIARYSDDAKFCWGAGNAESRSWGRAVAWAPIPWAPLP